MTASLTTAEGQEAAAADDSHALFSAQAHTLGVRVGEMHRAFARPTGNPAFDPEPVSAQDLHAWVEDVRRDAMETFTRLERKRSQLDEPVRAQADRLLAQRLSLIDRVTLDPIATEGLVKTRYHGDLHFGQVLVTGNDFVIIDFEGEPMRPVEERRRKHCPLRDAAGMVRSASYAAHATAERLMTDQRERQGEILRAVLDWEKAVTGAFVAGYRAATAGLASIPQDTAAFGAWLELFLIEKALYEVRYELESRPHWSLIPIRGLLGWVESPAGGAP
jgi:maltose alpha-D-glucosyltransferase/alpha-amylase